MPVVICRVGGAALIAAVAVGPTVAQTIVTAAPAASTPSTQTPPLSVEEAVRLALRDNPRLAAAVQEVHAARSNTRGASALANPQALFAPSLTGGVGAGSDTELLVQQPLELNGTRSARRGAAAARERQVIAQGASERQEIAFAARAAYYELVRVRERAALARDLLRAAQDLDRITHRQVEAGSRPAIDQTQTGIEVIRAQQQVTLADAAVAARETDLNTLMARSPITPVGVVSLPPSPSTLPVLPSAEVAVPHALAVRAEVQASVAATEAQRQDARLARAEGLPDLVPQYRATSITHGGGIQQGGFGVGITLPLFDYGSRRSQIRQAEESAHAEEDRTEAVRAQVRQEVVRALAEAQATQAVLQAFAQTQDGVLEQSQHLLDSARVGYEAGKTSVLQLLEAQRTFRQVQSDYIDAQIDHALARAELERATGGAIDATTPNASRAAAPPTSDLTTLTSTTNTGCTTGMTATPRMTR